MAEYNGIHPPRRDLGPPSDDRAFTLQEFCLSSRGTKISWIRPWSPSHRTRSRLGRAARRRVEGLHHRPPFVRSLKRPGLSSPTIVGLFSSSPHHKRCKHAGIRCSQRNPTLPQQCDPLDHATGIGVHRCIGVPRRMKPPPAIGEPLCWKVQSLIDWRRGHRERPLAEVQCVKMPGRMMQRAHKTCSTTERRCSSGRHVSTTSCPLWKRSSHTRSALQSPPYSPFHTKSAPHSPPFRGPPWQADGLQDARPAPPSLTRALSHSSRHSTGRPPTCRHGLSRVLPSQTRGGRRHKRWL